MAAVPYDPPLRPRSQSRRSSVSSASVFDRVRSGLVAAEHLADEAGHVAASVGKAARTAQVLEDDIERAYGTDDARRGDDKTARKKSSTTTSSGRRDYGGETTEGETEGEGDDRGGLLSSRAGRVSLVSCDIRSDSPAPLQPASTPRVVPYQPAPSTTARQRRKALPVQASDSVTDFSSDVDAAQEAVDDLADDVEHIASQRHRLTGLPYTTKLFKRHARDPPRSRTVELDEAVKLAAVVANTKTDLEHAYKDVSALQPRLKALLAGPPPPRSSSSSKALKHAHKAYDTLTRSYASLLDFVEDRAKEEKRARDDGTAEGSLLDRMRDDHPEWDKAKLIAQLQRAKTAALETTLAKVDYAREPYTGRWLLQQPFTELDDVLQAIDLAENGITKREDEKTGSWALGSLLSHAFSPAGKPRKTRSRKSSSKRRSHSEREVGKSRRYHSEDKPSSRHSSRGGASDVSTDTDEWSAVEKQQAGLLPSSSSSSKRAGGRGDDSDDSFDASQLPERVPTDDTSGYVESREELIEDAKAQRRTEHFYTPLLIVYWVCIALLYLYYLVARLLGFQSPLGNVDLGSHFGNSAWNDTHDGLVYSSASVALLPTTTASEVGPAELTGLPSGTGTSVVLDAASSLDALLRSGTLTSATASGVEGGVTAMAVAVHEQ
ncbi:hypothetical protein DMC30DRAFT_137446 [Rhodotorula diobovata]|uniref:Uncharacterized protein n=1 Tax=Rhodotorula diobovata TaxID=5288 RepID=A0A5C5FK39_9BASI|nr:hypothetical protein DMC30DRAFT_137446 [Rhodotorula diobovata]